MRIPAIAAWLVLVTQAWSATLYVSAIGTNPVSPFSSWDTAATNIQDAVDAAVDGDTVLVTNGTYSTGSPRVGLGTNIVSITQDISLRSVNGAAVTCIEGQDLYRCVLISNASAVVDGFTLTRGRVIYNTDYAYGGGAGAFVLTGRVENCVVVSNVVVGDQFVAQGGGIFLVSATLSNCVISQNSVVGRGAGGGLASYDGGRVLDCLISNNSAFDSGGGALFNGSYMWNCDVISNTVTDTANGQGGGISCSGSGSFGCQIEGCTIRGNAAIGTMSGGGGIVANNTVLLTNCLIEANTCSYGGGAFLGLNGFSDTPQMWNCTVRANRGALGGGMEIWVGRVINSTVADNYGSIGGGIFVDTSIPKIAAISNCVVVDNTATNGGFMDSGKGGGIYGGQLVLADSLVASNRAEVAGGGAFISMGEIESCLFVGNSAASDGGGIHMGSVSFARNSIIAANQAPNGGGVSYGGRFYQCTITGNTATNGGGSALGGSFGNSVVYGNLADSNSNYADNVSMNFSCAAPLPTNGVGNIDSNPLFVNAAAGDFHLQAGSPCIDAAGVTNGAAFDYDGIPRPLDGNNDGIAAYDMGAYEYVNPLADSDGDGLVDTDELARGTSPVNSDTDGDHTSDGKEVIAGTDPLDSNSVFEATRADTTSSGLVVCWSSATNRTYTLSRATNLMQGFSVVVTGLVATPPENVYTDATATGAENYYDVEVVP